MQENLHYTVGVYVQNDGDYDFDAQEENKKEKT